MTDYTQLTDEELETEFQKINAERTRRQGLDTVYQQIDQVLNKARAQGIVGTPEPGANWEQPSGAHDAYKRGDTVTHDGRTWVSTVSPNTWEPGVSGWHHQPEPDPDTGEPGVPEWVRPSGAHDAYALGDRVIFEGQEYESVHEGANTWSPTEYSDAWKLIQ